MNISQYIKKIKLLFYIGITITLATAVLGLFSVINQNYLWISLIVLLIILGILFIKLNTFIVRLQQSVLNSQVNLKQTEQSLASRDQKIQELVALNYAMNKAILYARISKKGSIISLSERFAKLLNIEHDYERKNLIDLINLNEVQKNRLLGLITQSSGSVFNEEFELKTSIGQKIWLDISILTIFKESGNSERLVLCSDISKRKEAQIEIERLNAYRYREKEELQKSNASQIVEAQEEERKRIAKEIHDSIGQMLTALKLNIESINLENTEKAYQLIEGLKQLSKNLIQGTRIATFNLTPPELKDYGIGIALDKMAKELSKLTGKNILFENKSNFEQRFDSLIETNLYRVTQEAVNNAIKYANSNYILITINHSNSLLSITIEDDGTGFDINTIPSKPNNNAKGGMGLFFMKERMNYINGRIFINSIPNEGSRIILNYTIS